MMIHGDGSARPYPQSANAQTMESSLNKRVQKQVVKRVKARQQKKAKAKVAVRRVLVHALSAEDHT